MWKFREQLVKVLFAIDRDSTACQTTGASLGQHYTETGQEHVQELEALMPSKKLNH